MSILTHSLLKKMSSDLDKDGAYSGLRWIDLYAAQFVADSLEKAGGEFNDEVVILTVLVSALSAKGETYLSLDRIPEEIVRRYVVAEQFSGEFAERIRRSSVVRAISDDQERGFPIDEDNANPCSYPLVLWRNRLYLAKYWRLHRIFESWLDRRLKRLNLLSDDHVVPLKNALTQVFSIQSNSECQDIDWQAVSAAHTLLQNFTVITGGPGTGKTTTAASLLHVLMTRHQLNVNQPKSTNVKRVEPVNPRLSVRLLAPTGKAAIRLADSIRYQLLLIENRLLGSDLISVRMSDCLPETGETIHRFLYEYNAFDSGRRQLNSTEILLDTLGRGSPHIDVVVIDEASMIDLALMVEFTQVISDDTQVILMGDHRQLPAVEPGQVFADMVKRFSQMSYTQDFSNRIQALTGFSASELVNEGIDSEVIAVVDSSLPRPNFHPLCQLRKTYRFDGDLKVAADLIKSGDLHIFRRQFSVSNEVKKHLRWHCLDGKEDILNELILSYRAYFDQVSKGASLRELADAFGQYQILCSTHAGSAGVNRINQVIEQHFIYQGAKGAEFERGLYHGKAILVTRNQASLGIYNGDIGFVIESANAFEVHFPINGEKSIAVSPGRLKEWQPAYAMTVHKSQGSEYQHVGVILADYARELLSRPMLYTAVTRSKSQCDIWAASDAIGKAFEQL